MMLNNGGCDNYLITSSNFNGWEGSKVDSCNIFQYLINTDNGVWEPIAQGYVRDMFSFSTKGRYVIWYSAKDRCYLTYNISNGTTRNISKDIPVKIYSETIEEGRRPYEYGLGFWAQNDEFVYIYDRYDIWRVDPAALQAPVNITNGYGRKTKTILRFVAGSGISRMNYSLKPDSTVFLCALNENSKQNGFFSKKLNDVGDPLKLIMSPNIYYFPDNLSFIDGTTLLLKAKRADTYLLNRSNAAEFPNLNITRDFKTFKPVSRMSPQTQFNWFTSELITWKTFDGQDARVFYINLKISILQRNILLFI